jgi:FixJ family two-component response regulator
MTDQPIVFAVDDDSSVLRALSRLLRSHGYQVQGYDSAQPFLEAIQPTTHGCVLLDLSLPEISGLELQERLLASGNRHPIVFLTGQGSVQASVRALKAGAMDFIEKPFEDTVLVAAVQHAIEKDRELRKQELAIDAVAKRLATLTAREAEVFRHVIAGRLNKQIAARLGTAEKTIKVHRARVMNKMAVRSVAELTRLADFAGIEPER